MDDSAVRPGQQAVAFGYPVTMSSPAISTDLSGPELLSRIQALAPLLLDNAEEAERIRKPVDEVMQALEDTGVFRFFVPRRFGGLELDLDTYVSIGIALGEGCTSTAWVTTFCMEHNWMLAQFAPKAQEEIFGSQPYIMAPGSIAMGGVAEPVDGGFELTGRWQWGTGVMHADWVLLSARVPGDGPPDVRLFILPIDRVEVIDTWYVDGMIGTGSNDIAAERVFVPEHHGQVVAQMMGGRGAGALWHDSPLFRIPMLPLLCLAAGVPAFGAAKRAVQIFRERLRKRVLFGSSTLQAEKPAAQIRLAHADVTMRGAEQIARAVAHELAPWGEREETCPPEIRARLRMQVGHVVRTCRDVVRDISAASGATAHRQPSALERIHRDVHTLAAHTVFDPDTSGELLGRLMLGMEAEGLI